MSRPLTALLRFMADLSGSPLATRPSRARLLSGWPGLPGLLGLLALLPASSCLGPDDRLPVLAGLATQTTTWYAGFEARAADLESAAAAFCAEPNDVGLGATREAWWAARGAWKRAETARFGPVVEYPERLGPKLDDWPVHSAAVEELVAADTALDFSLMGTATRGLPVVEWLLWSPNEAEALEALRTDARRCAVMAGAAADLADNAALLRSTWADDWAARIAAPVAGDGDAWETSQDAIDEWTNRIGFTVENLHLERIGNPLGDADGGTPRPDALESRPSGRSVDDCRDALEGARQVWRSDTDGGGLAGLLLEGAVLPGEIDRLFTEADDALGAIPGTLEEAIEAGDPSVVAAQEALLAVQVVIQVDLAQALGVTIAFNDNDGD